MYDYVNDCAGEGTIGIKEIDVTFPDGSAGKDIEYACWLPVPGGKWNGMGVFYIFGMECGMMEVEEMHYDQVWPKAEPKRGRVPKGQFIDRDGVRRHQSIWAD